MMAKKKIFFSYSRADGSEFALRLAVDLKQKGFDVWIDQEDIRAGSEWDIEIEKALETCDCMLFIETEKSVVSANVLDEVYFALDENKKVIPVIVVDSKTPFRLKRLQHIDFTKDYATGLAILETELENSSPTVTYTPGETIIEAPASNKAKSKYAALPFIVGSFVILAAAIIFLVTSKTNNEPSAKKEEVIVAKDIPISNKVMPYEQRDTSEINVSAVTNSASSPVPTNQKAIKPKTNKSNQQTQLSNTTIQSNTVKQPDLNPGNLNELYLGDWQLVHVEPKSQSPRGYLKIEELSEGKISIKSYVQFYYPESKATSYLTVFNAFANCNSCVFKSDMKLIAEDVAVGSRTIKTLNTDQPDGGKEGDVILDANSNKSIRATVTVHFNDAQNAIIKIEQPVTIALAHELMLEPFVYIFRFKKSD